MKATNVLFVFVFVLLAMAMAVAAVVIAAEPLHPAAGLRAAGDALDPAWMLLSGAALLGLAGAVRRYVP